MLEYHACMQCFCLSASAIFRNNNIQQLETRVALSGILITGGPGSPGSPGGPTTWKNKREK